MSEATALLSFLLAAAVLYGAHESRFPSRHFSSMNRRPSRGHLFALRVLSAAIALLGVYLWARTGDVTAALLVGLTSLCVSASVFVLLTPLWPRVVWLATAASLVAVPVLFSTGMYG